MGYDFNTVEFAVREGIPYAIDFCNPAPDAAPNSVGQENFEWIVENAAEMAISRAKSQKEGQINLTWGTFIQHALAGPAAPAKKRSSRASSKKKASSTQS